MGNKMRKDDNSELEKYRKLRAFVKWESCRRNPEFQEEYQKWKHNHQARMSKLRRKRRWILSQDIDDPELTNLLWKWAGSGWSIRDPFTYPDSEPFPECFDYLMPINVINLHKTIKFFVDENLKWQKELISKFGSEENILRNADPRTLKSYLKGEGSVPYPTESADELILQIDITKPIKYLIPCIKRDISRAQHRMRQNAIILVRPNGQEIRLPLDRKVPKLKKTREEFEKMFKVWDWRKNGETYSQIGKRFFPTDDPESRIAKVKRYYKHANDLIMKEEYRFI